MVVAETTVATTRADMVAAMTDARNMADPKKAVMEAPHSATRRGEEVDMVRVDMVVVVETAGKNTANNREVEDMTNALVEAPHMVEAVTIGARNLMDTEETTTMIVHQAVATTTTAHPEGAAITIVHREAATTMTAHPRVVTEATPADTAAQAIKVSSLPVHHTAAEVDMEELQTISQAQLITLHPKLATAEIPACSPMFSACSLVTRKSSSTRMWMRTMRSNSMRSFTATEAKVVADKLAQTTLVRLLPCKQ